MAPPGEGPKVDVSCMYRKFVSPPEGPRAAVPAPPMFQKAKIAGGPWAGFDACNKECQVTNVLKGWESLAVAQNLLLAEEATLLPKNKEIRKPGQTDEEVKLESQYFQDSLTKDKKETCSAMPAFIKCAQDKEACKTTLEELSIGKCREVLEAYHWDLGPMNMKLMQDLANPEMLSIDESYEMLCKDEEEDKKEGSALEAQLQEEEKKEDIKCGTKVSPPTEVQTPGQEVMSESKISGNGEQLDLEKGPRDSQQSDLSKLATSSQQSALSQLAAQLKGEINNERASTGGGHALHATVSPELIVAKLSEGRPIA